jgi:hypothetical protein
LIFRNYAENLRAARLQFPIKIRADISAAPAASLAGKPQFEIGEPNVIRPSIAADRDVMAAPVIGATRTPDERISANVILAFCAQHHPPPPARFRSGSSSIGGGNTRQSMPRAFPGQIGPA